MKGYLDYLAEEGYAKSTIDDHRRTIRLLEMYLEKENIKLIETSHNDVMGYVSLMQRENLKVTTQKTRLTIFRRYFSYLVKQGTCVKNPTIDIKLKGAKKKVIAQVLNEEEIGALYDDFNTVTEDKKYVVVLGLICFQGASVKALENLLVTDINLDKAVVYFADGLRVNERVVPLSAKQVFLLIQYIQNKKGEKLIDCNVNNLIYTLSNKLQKLNYKGSINDLRSSRIMLWIKQYNLRKVQYYCGFRYLSSLDKYRLSEIEDLREQLDRFLG